MDEHSRGSYLDGAQAGGNLGERAVRGGAFSIMSNVLGQVIQLGGTMMLARILSPDHFGIVAMVTSISGLLFSVSDLGLTDATIQSKNISQGQASGLFWITNGSNLAITVAMMAVSPLLARFYNEPRVLGVSLVMSVEFALFGLANQHYALLRRAMQFSRVSLSLLACTLISNVVALLLAWRGAGYWCLAFREIAFFLARAIAAWILCKWRPSIPKTRWGVSSLVKYGVRTTGSLAFSYLAENLDKILIGKAFGAKELGYYNRAFGLFGLPIGQFTSSLHHVAVATLSRLRDQPTEYVRYYVKAISALSFLGMPLAAFMVVESSDIVLVFFGEQWLRSAELLSILGLSAGFRMVYLTNQWLTASLGRADRRLKWQMVSFFVTTAAVGVGTLYGTNGVAAGYSLSAVVLLIPGILYAGRPVGLSLRALVSGFWQNLAAAASAAVVCSLTINMIGPTGHALLRLLLSLVVYLVAYSLSILLFHGGVRPFRQLFGLIRMTLGVRSGKLPAV
jgi:O-antigen/teichoic acid export membrane protein